MSTDNHPTGDRAHRIRKVGRVRALLVGGAVLSSLGATGAIVATAADGAASPFASTSDSTGSESSSTTHSSLASNGSGDPHATSGGS